MDTKAVLDRAATLLPAALAGRGYLLVGIGGRGGSGKTTLAHSIPGAQVVSTDEFWDGTWFDLARLRSEVVDSILRAEAAEYHAYSWELQRPVDEVRVVLPRGVIVIEGICALHLLFREAYDLRVWVEAPRELRLARGIARDGEAARSLWETQWMPSEDRYVEGDDPIPSAHLIVNGF